MILLHDYRQHKGSGQRRGVYEANKAEGWMVPHGGRGWCPKGEGRLWLNRRDVLSYCKQRLYRCTQREKNARRSSLIDCAGG